jgi:hypothetical protein
MWLVGLDILTIQPIGPAGALSEYLNDFNPPSAVA